MTTSSQIALGLDFGTESVRAIVVDLDGNERGAAVSEYAHRQIVDTLPGTGEKLPPDFALQHPSDWIESAAKAVRTALSQAKLRGDDVIGIGVDFTSCTMLPAKSDGTPLCLTPQLASQNTRGPNSGNTTARSRKPIASTRSRQRKEPWLDRYGGIIGLEWFFPKILETLEEAPEVYDAAEVWLEGGDWFVWQLVDCDASQLPRSTCQAGYKAMWNSGDGYPSREFFAALDPRMANVVEKMPGRMLAPGESAGALSSSMADKFGLKASTPVSAATIDAHAGVPGAGAAKSGTFVMVMGTSSCHMLNADTEQLVPGVAGVVRGGILPGFFGYETGQAAVGDAFDWLRRTVGQSDFKDLTRQAESLPPGAEGVMCMDWFNGCRTPLMDGKLRGAFVGLWLGHGPHHLYRALMEASAFGVRWIVELLREHKVPVVEFVATGGLPHHNPLLVKIYADVLGETILVHPSKQGPALGAAILGVLAAGKSSPFASAVEAVEAMAGARKGVAGREPIIVKPDSAAHKQYNELYRRYRELADMLRT